MPIIDLTNKECKTLKKLLFKHRYPVMSEVTKTNKVIRQIYFKLSTKEANQ